MFLQALYRHWRKMFCAVVVLAVAQVFFMYKAVETVPFFLYNMYSTPQRNGDTSHRTTIYLNGHRFDASKLSGHEEEMLMGSLSYYKKLKAQRYFATDSLTAARRLQAIMPAGWYDQAFGRLTNTGISEDIFLHWWASYLAQVSGQRVDSFSLVESTVFWKPKYYEANDTLSLINYYRAAR